MRACALVCCSQKGEIMYCVVYDTTVVVDKDMKGRD